MNIIISDPRTVFASSIRENGLISRYGIDCICLYSDGYGKDMMDYSLINEINDGYGIPMDYESAEKVLDYLREQASRPDSVCGYREKDIIENAEPEDLTFRGLYSRDGATRHMPLYGLNGMEFVPFPEIYICG